MDLEKILEKMDVPALRQDVSKQENLKWLLRNLSINNGDHPDIDDVLREIKRRVL